MITFSDIKASTDTIRAMGGPVQGEWLFDLARQTSDNAVICEVGSYYGYMTTVLAHACRDSNRRVFTIDHMIGSMCDYPEGSACAYLDLVDNLVKHGVWDKVVPFPLRSLDVVPLLKLLKPRIELIYLDGNHSDENVLAELQAFDQFVAVNGMVCGDDFMTQGNLRFATVWANSDASVLDPIGVQQAVWKFFRNDDRWEPIESAPGNQFGFRKIK